MYMHMHMYMDMDMDMCMCSRREEGPQTARCIPPLRQLSSAAKREKNAPLVVFVLYNLPNRCAPT